MVASSSLEGHILSASPSKAAWLEFPAAVPCLLVTAVLFEASLRRNSVFFLRRHITGVSWESTEKTKISSFSLSNHYYFKVKFSWISCEWRMDVETRDHLRLPIHAILVHDPLSPFTFGSTAQVEYESPLCADYVVSRFYITFFSSGFPVSKLSCSLALQAIWVLPPTSREEEPLILWLNDCLGYLTSKAAPRSR